MSTSIDQPLSAHHEDGKICVVMASGLEVAFPVLGNRRLEGQPRDKLNHIEISPLGLHWPDLDEDLSIRGILAGNCGQRRRRAA